MSRCFPLYAVLVFCVACHSSEPVATLPPVDSLANTGINDILLNTSYQTTQLQGVYTGSFDGSPISISINYVSGKNISGYNVHKGLKRNLRGILEPMGSRFKLSLDEPGDNRYDGHFDLFIDTASYSGQGTWIPKNDSTLKKKTFTLVRKKEDEYSQLATSWSDTLGHTINLKEDGAVAFSYYVNKGTPQEQMENFSGNWQQKKDSLLIFWQPNTLFLSRRSSFFIVREQSDTDSTTYIDKLTGEGAEWYNDIP